MTRNVARGAHRTARAARSEPYLGTVGRLPYTIPSVPDVDPVRATRLRKRAFRPRVLLVRVQLQRGYGIGLW